MRIGKPVILIPFICIAFFQAVGQEKPVAINKVDTPSIKVDSLKAAIVTATLRPHMNGDTLEYNVTHLKMQRNTMVEELLERLPGLHIDPDGTITYNGEKIQHLLVDGEDIFGDDPTIVTRNFDASKIARVQILDRKSDDARFTGIDDGTRTKTLNLVLKESAKDGYFGHAAAGTDTKGIYNINAAVAGFEDKEQFTALGITANTGVVDFSNATSDAAITLPNGNSDALGATAGIGIPRFDAVGLHYANTWTGPSRHLNANYQYSHLFTEPITFNQSLQTQPGSVYTQQQRNHSTNQQDRHWLFGIYDWAPSTKSTFMLVFHYSNSLGPNEFSSSGNSALNDTLVNTSQRTIQDKAAQTNIDGSLGWRIQLGKSTERTFSVIASANQEATSTNGYLFSLNRFYQPNGLLEGIDTVDQRKLIEDHNLNTGGSITYTQPLWKEAVLSLSYGLILDEDAPLQATFDRGDGKFQAMVDSLTTHFKNNNINQRGTLNLQGKTGRFVYVLGADRQEYSYAQHDLIADSMLRLHYNNWTPRVLINYNLNKATFVHFRYNSVTMPPSPAQLTPMSNNSDPLHITTGNPNLKPAFNQNFIIEFHQFKSYLIDMTLNASLNHNSISTKTITDSLGRQISQPVNVNGGQTGDINLSLGHSVLGCNATIHLAGSYARTMNYINAELSRNNAYTGGGGLSLNKYIPDKLSLQLSTNVNYFDQKSSINTTAPIRYWTQSHTASITLYLIKYFVLNTNAAYTWQQKTEAFSTSTSTTLWNASIGRNLLQGNLTAKFLLKNILNANAGISRTNIDNINTQSSTNILGRYWMLSMTYHFDKKFHKK